MSVDNLPDKSRNLSSYIMKCGSSEKFELLLEKFQQIRRKFFRNICCNIFMKQLGNIRGKRNIPPAFTTVQNWRSHLCQSLLPAVIHHCRLPHHRTLQHYRLFPCLRLNHHRRKEPEDDETTWNCFKTSRRRANSSSHLCPLWLRRYWLHRPQLLYTAR